jgi:hypothetical protein
MWRRAMSCGRQKDSKMTEKRGYSSVGTLVMARAQKRLAADNQDEELAARGGIREVGAGGDKGRQVGIRPAGAPGHRKRI